MEPYKKLNFTQTDLSTLFNKKLSEKTLEPANIASKYAVPIRVVNEIIENKILFKKEHYTVIQHFLNIDFETLFGQKELTFSQKVSILFNEWCLQKDLHEKTD